jgi:acetyl esterase/lipase
MGYYAVIPDYRLFPEVTFPCFVLDGAQAAAYLLDHMEASFGERRSLFVAGHSAGAHIAMLLAVDERYMAQAGRSRDDIAGVIGIAGPYDFLPIESDSLRRIFPTPMAQWASQPVNFVGPKTPPVLLAHGDRDGTVWLRNSVNMADRLAAAGGDVTLKIYRGLDHRDVLKPFVSFFRDRAGILGDIDEFVAEHNGRFTIRSRAGGYVARNIECTGDGVH